MKKKSIKAKSVKPKIVAKKAPGNSRTKPKASKKAKHFPIVGIGASAGGLEAFSTLLAHLSPNLDMAYVFIQHLSPNHESYLPQIISRKTNMPVHQATNNLPVKKNNVYIIPPKHSLTIKDGILTLIPEKKGQRSFHPIDLFLSSLALVYRNHAIGIILSGTATDGTLGLKAIKAEGGITFAQDESALYQGMPRYAAEMGYVDRVLSPEKMAAELAAVSNNPLSELAGNEEYIKGHATEMDQIQSILLSGKHVDFSQYKQSTIQRRIMRRMILNNLNTLKDYIGLIKNSPVELAALHQDLLISVTDFFRDPVMNSSLTQLVFPKLIKDRKPSDPIRIWVPGCSTGEETLTIAMLLVEFLGSKSLTIPIQIFGTDLNEKAIEKARIGVYSKSAVQSVSAERLEKFFTKIDGHYQVIKTLRDRCILAQHDLLKDPPFSNMDIISCQNLLIYLEPTAQQRIIQTFHYALKPSGVLIVGKSESVGAAIDLFETVDKNKKLFKKKPTQRTVNLNFAPRAMSGFPNTPNYQERINVRKAMDTDKELERILLSQYTAPGLIVNKDMEIVRFLGAVATYLEPTYGKASFQLIKMVKEELAFELRGAIGKIKKTGQKQHREGISINKKNHSLLIDFDVIPIKTPENDFYYLIMFREHTPAIITDSKKLPGGKSSQQTQRIQLLENQIIDARSTIKLITEEFETVREELQSSNEEVLSSNEELQSINEELETSKEELQSTNEELMTINEELHKRNIDLKEMNDYADAIFETMHEALIIIADDFRVRIANKGFYLLFQTTEEETEGLVFDEFNNRLMGIVGLTEKLKAVQQKQKPLVNHIVHHHFDALGDKILLLNAQKLPMKEGNESLILLAIQDITEQEKISSRIKESEERFRLLLQNAFDIITLFDQKGTILYISPSVEQMLGYSASERTGKNILQETDTHPDDKLLKETMFKDCLKNPGKNIRAEFRLQHKNGEFRYIDAICRNMLDDPAVNGVIANYRDITERKVLEQQKDDFIGIASHELKTPVTSIKAYAQILQEDFEESGNPDAAALASKMNSQIDRLTMLISDLLDFTHIEGDKLKFRNEPYHLNNLINEIAGETQQTVIKHAIVVELEKDIVINGDRYRIGEVLNNLLSNAIKYSPQGDRVIISSKVGKKEVTVSIRDFGIGISDDKVGKIFDRFYRVSDASINTFPGLGLGLYIAAEIIKKQGGKIWVKSEISKGTTVFFTLPLS